MAADIAILGLASQFVSVLSGAVPYVRAASQAALSSSMLLGAILIPKDPLAVIIALQVHGALLSYMVQMLSA